MSETAPGVFHRAAPMTLSTNAVLQMLDVVTTAIILGAGGVEANPAAAWMMSSWGFSGWIAFKVVLAAAFLALLPALRRCGDGDRKAAGVMAFGFAVLMGLVVLNNSIMIGLYVIG